MSRSDLKENCGGWTAKQVACFAKAFTKRYPSQTWDLLANELRMALVDSWVMTVVLGQDRAETGGVIGISDIGAFRDALLRELDKRHLYPVWDQSHLTGVEHMCASCKAKA